MLECWWTVLEYTTGILEHRLVHCRLHQICQPWWNCIISSYHATLCFNLSLFLNYVLRKSFLLSTERLLSIFSELFFSSSEIFYHIWKYFSTISGNIFSIQKEYSMCHFLKLLQLVIRRIIMYCTYNVHVILYYKPCNFFSLNHQCVVFFSSE